MLRRFGSVSALLALAVAATLALAETAAAHAYLVRSTPEAGARLERPPRALVLYFSEPFVEASERVTVRVAGEVVDLPAPQRDGTIVRQALPARLDGVVVVNWNVLSTDGHPSLGEFAFAVGADAARAQLARGEPRQPTPWALTATTWLFFVGLALALGGLVSERFIWSRRGASEKEIPAAPVGLGLSIAATGALLHLVVLAGERAGGLRDLAMPPDASVVWDTRAGRLTAGILLLLLGAALARRWRAVRNVALVLLLATTVLSAIRGHSGTAGHWWAVLADAVHLAAAAIWIGALIHLVRVVYPRRRAGDFGEAVRRYAALALVTVALAVIGGLGTALAQFGSVDEVFDTGYGRTLLVKGGLIALALAVAFAARSRALGFAWPERGLIARLGTFELASGAAAALLVAALAAPPALRVGSTVLFVGGLVGSAVAIRYGLRATATGRSGAVAFVGAGGAGIVSIFAGGVAAAAAAAADPRADAGGDAMLLVRLALLASGLALGAAALLRALPQGRFRLAALRRLTASESALLVAALAVAALLVNVAPPRAAAVGAGLPRSLGPPPLQGPAIRLADFTGQVAVGLTATERVLRFQVVVSGEPVEGIRLTAEAEPPGQLSADLYPRRCGQGCFTIRYRLRPGRTIVTADVAVPGFDGGKARFVVPWPPRRDRSELLRRVADTMLAVPELEMTEVVVSDTSAERFAGRYRLSGRRLLAAEMYRGGAVDVRVLGRDQGLTQLAFALPASDIWYRMWVDDRYLVRREIIINRGHLITRSFRYPAR